MTERQPVYASMPRARMGMHACAATTTRDSSSSSNPPAPSIDLVRRNESASARSFSASGSVRVATIGKDRRTACHAASLTAGRFGLRKRNISGSYSGQPPERGSPLNACRMDDPAGTPREYRVTAALRDMEHGADRDACTVHIDILDAGLAPGRPVGECTEGWMEPPMRRKHPGPLIVAIPGTVRLVRTVRLPGTPGPAPA